MRGRALCVVLGSLLLFATLLGAGGDVAVAAKAPVDVPGSMWVAQGLLKAARSGGRDLAVFPAIVGFGPLDDPPTPLELAPGEATGILRRSP